MFKAFKQYNVTPIARAGSSIRGSTQTPRSSAAAASLAAVTAAAGEAGIGLSTAGSQVAASAGSEANTFSEGSKAVHGIISHTGESYSSDGPRQGVEQQPAQTSAPAAVRMQATTGPTRGAFPQCVPVTAQVPPPGWSFYYDSLTRHGQAQHGEAAAAESAMADGQGL
jgi:hypothetical protein